MIPALAGDLVNAAMQILDLGRGCPTRHPGPPPQRPERTQGAGLPRLTTIGFTSRAHLAPVLLMVGTT